MTDCLTGQSGKHEVSVIKRVENRPEALYCQTKFKLKFLGAACAISRVLWA